MEGKKKFQPDRKLKLMNNASAVALFIYCFISLILLNLDFATVCTDVLRPAEFVRLTIELTDEKQSDHYISKNY